MSLASARFSPKMLTRRAALADARCDSKYVCEREKERARVCRKDRTRAGARPLRESARAPKRALAGGRMTRGD